MTYMCFQSKREFTNTVDAIKAVRVVLNIGLKEAKQVVEGITVTEDQSLKIFNHWLKFVDEREKREEHEIEISESDWEVDHDR